MNELSPQQQIKPPVDVVTLGCRLNTYESEIMRDHATAHSDKHTIIINTCAVTKEAERQSRQAIRKARRAHPEAMIIAAGCSVQLNPQQYASMPEVDRALGNHDKMLAHNFSFNTPEVAKVHVTDINTIKESAYHLVSHFENHARGFIEIQNGCDHSCTFCSIVQARGKNRSAPIAAIIQNINSLVTQGCNEVVLTGVDITGYGQDLPAQPKLGQMIRRLFRSVPQLPRLRLSSLDPAEIDDDLYELIANEPRLMPHFHLSLQSGDDMILKRMKRRHKGLDVINVVNNIRQRRPHAVFGADIIAGFPTETEAMFQHTINIIKACQLSYLHVFPYSARTGTSAARMPQVAGSIIKQRAETLRVLGQQQLQSLLAANIGKTVSVLIERNNRGHTEEFMPVIFEEDSETTFLLGAVVHAQIVGIKNDHLLAKVCE